MFKVGILGNYGHNNIGDESILHGILATLPGDIEVTVFTESVSKSKSEQYSRKVNIKQFRRNFCGKAINIPLIISDILKSIGQVQRFIIGGGGLLNDSYKMVTFYYFIIGLFIRILGKRYDVYGISIGPLKSKYSKILSAMFLKMADKVIVRDESSHNFAMQHSDSVEKLPDLALAIPYINKEKEDFVAFNVIPYYKVGTWFSQDANKYLKYIDEMCEIINFVCEKGISVKLFPVDLVFDMEAIVDIYKRLTKQAKRYVEVVDISNSNMLIEFLGRSKLMVGCRLHAAVLSVLTGTPYLSLAYQEKVVNFGGEVGNSENCHWLSNLPLNEIKEQFLDMYNNPQNQSEFLIMQQEQQRKLSALVEKNKAFYSKSLSKS